MLGKEAECSSKSESRRVHCQSVLDPRRRTEKVAEPPEKFPHDGCQSLLDEHVEHVYVYNMYNVYNVHGFQSFRRQRKTICSAAHQSRR